MFTGIVQAVGEVAVLQPQGQDLRLQIDTGKLTTGKLAEGDSVAVSGVCLTVVECVPKGVWVDVSGETLQQTTLGGLAVGEPVNLESALTMNTPLGGHLVTGHVDGIGVVQERREDGRSERLRIRVPPALSRYIAHKGSICMDGVSLTINAVDGTGFGVNIVPYTLAETTLGSFRPGRRVNLEVDIIARYLERLLLGEGETAVADGNTVTREFLQRFGYIKG